MCKYPFKQVGFLAKYGENSNMDEMKNDLDQVVSPFSSRAAQLEADLLRYQAEREQLLARIEELVAELRECMNQNTLTAEDSDNPYILHGEELDRAEHARIAGRS